MKTRAEIYGNEATDLLRIVTMYPGLCEHQLLCFHPGKEDTTKALLSHWRGRAAFSNRRRWLFPGRANTKN